MVLPLLDDPFDLGAGVGVVLADGGFGEFVELVDGALDEGGLGIGGDGEEALECGQGAFGGLVLALGAGGVFGGGFGSIQRAGHV